MKENSAAVHAQVPVDVATFLLNEKRADIHSIEARLKVNVVLIPNTNLETPNYKVERLRHDDLNQADALPASYNLVTAPAEEEAKEPAAQEARPPRQQAAVQGVTPERPAPASAQPKPQAPRPAEQHPGIIDRIFGWFKSGSAAPASPQPAAAPRRDPQVPQPEFRDRGDRFRGRNERPDPRQGRGRDHRGERPQRQDRQDRNSRPERPLGEQRPPRGERPQGHDRAPSERPDSREPRPQEHGRPPAPQAGAPDAREGDHERKRRRRGGRDRGERGERRGPPPPAPHREETRVAAGPAPTERAGSVPAAEEFIAVPAPGEREPVHQVVMAAEPQPEYRPASPAPVASAVSPAPREPDPAEIERALKESGLELVQTRSGARDGSMEPEPKFVPAKRERRPPPPDLDEPLVQVETGREPPTPKT